jgi:hypothetical protein
MVDGDTCSGQGYVHIGSRNECINAFDFLVYTPKTNYGYESVSNLNSGSYQKGCFSSCFSSNAGYFCRNFNSHTTGAVGHGTDLSAEEYQICRNNAGTAKPSAYVLAYALRISAF